jgi:large subunit ribosomal protein L29
MIKMEEVRRLPVDEVKIRLKDAEEELANVRFQLALHQLDNPLKIRYLRRDIARLKTVIREQKLGIRKEATA